ncbi:MAG: hypothetical protein WHS38_04595 [Thermodesulforhabdaceae bacterium]
MTDGSNCKNDLPIMSIGTVLYCSKWRECVEFYRRILACDIIFQNDFFVELSPSTGARLGLMDVSRTTKQVTHPESIVISIQVSSIEKTIKVLRQIFPNLPDSFRCVWGVKLIEIKDPDGRVVEFWEREPT